MAVTRILFASAHGYVDPSSGAAQATRDFLRFLVGRGVDGPHAHVGPAVVDLLQQGLDLFLFVRRRGLTRGDGRSEGDEQGGA